MCRPRQLLLSLGLLPALLHCRDTGVGAAPPPGGAADPADCRSYATAADVRWGGASGELACRFDAASFEHVCELSSGAGRFTTLTSEYASVSDFVEAGRHIGKLTSLRESRSEGGRQRSLAEHRYDELGRLTRTFEDDGRRTIVYAYSDYDDAGRPRLAVTATGSVEGCDAEVVEIAYDDARRQVSRRFRALDPARCGFAERSLLEHYDVRGNRVAVEEADGSGVETRFAASPAATRQVCL